MNHVLRWSEATGLLQRARNAISQVQLMYIRACKLSDLQVSGLPFPSLLVGLGPVNSITDHTSITFVHFSKSFVLKSEPMIYGEESVSVLIVLPAVN